MVMRSYTSVAGPTCQSGPNSYGAVSSTTARCVLPSWRCTNLRHFPHSGTDRRTCGGSSTNFKTCTFVPSMHIIEACQAHIRANSTCQTSDAPSSRTPFALVLANCRSPRRMQKVVSGLVALVGSCALGAVEYNHVTSALLLPSPAPAAAHLPERLAVRHPSRTLSAACQMSGWCAGMGCRSRRP